MAVTAEPPLVPELTGPEEDAGREVTEVEVAEEGGPEVDFSADAEPEDADATPDEGDSADDALEDGVCDGGDWDDGDFGPGDEDVDGL